jgi:ubiquinone/menaquinone biosynthesis C-methylase UbiE
VTDRRPGRDRSSGAHGASPGDAPPRHPNPHHHHDREDEERYVRALERTNRFQEPEGRALIADLGLPPGSRGLDVGCGVGLYTLWLAEAVGPAGRVVGIEPGPDRVEAAQQVAGRELGPPRLEFRPGDGALIAADDGAFDWVWASDALHHLLDTVGALREFARVLRPGGRIIVKETQTAPALFLPGHPELERRLQRAEMEWSREEGGGCSFQERRQLTAASMRQAGLTDMTVHTYLIERRAPLDDVTRAYLEDVLFARNWGARLQEFLAADDWERRSALCEPGSPDFVLRSPAYYCLCPITVFAGRWPG